MLWPLCQVQDHFENWFYVCAASFLTMQCLVAKKCNGAPGTIVKSELVLTIYNNFTLFTLKQIVVCWNKFRPAPAFALSTKAQFDRVDCSQL